MRARSMISIVVGLVATVFLLGNASAEPKKPKATPITYKCACTTNDSVKRAKNPPKGDVCPGGHEITLGADSTESSAARKCLVKDKCPSQYCVAVATRVTAPDATGTKSDSKPEDKPPFEKRFKEKTPTSDLPPNFDRDYAPDWAHRPQLYTKRFESVQGFAGVYDPRTGNIIVRPSAPCQPWDLTGLKLYKDNKERNQDTWVRRNGGHEELAPTLDSEWTNRSEDVDRLRAFTLIRNGLDGSRREYHIEFFSLGVNGKFKDSGKDSLLPAKWRDDVIDAVRYHTKDRKLKINTAAPPKEAPC
jgi:hypothetical protein